MDVECVVIGAGVVGLAVAARLSCAGVEVLLLERESTFGSVTSARNSEVIHAGIYYRPDSLKALLCVQGKRQLYQYCEERGIRFSQCGKLIVSTSDEQTARLQGILRNAESNGAGGMSILSAREVQAVEPEIECKAALHSSTTGIVDSHALMLSLLADAENSGATLVKHAEVRALRFERQNSCYQLTVDEGGAPVELQSRYVVNAAGHGACAVAATLDQMHHELKPEPVYYKGNYFRLNSRAPFSRLIYPVPEPGGLGVHLTLDLSGNARFGPDVEPVAQEHYQVNPERSEAFYAAIRRYWPQLADNSLEPDYAGVRPRVLYKGRLHDDFLIQDSSEHGLPGLINLFGIESPGLTSCLAIAQTVAQRILNDE